MATIDGKLYPLSECTWVMFEPCGCASGVSLAEYEPSEDAAWKSFTSHGTAREVEREKAGGAELRLMLSTAIREGGPASLLMTLGDCKHEPKWGRKPSPPLPDGHVWAVRHYEGRASHTKHAVVLGEPTYPGEWGVPGKPLCGASTSSWKRESWYVEAPNAWASARIGEVLNDALPCTRCEAKARVATEVAT